jgi:hypothetical protein
MGTSLKVGTDAHSSQTRLEWATRHPRAVEGSAVLRTSPGNVFQLSHREQTNGSA